MRKIILNAYVVSSLAFGALLPEAMAAPAVSETVSLTFDSGNEGVKAVRTTVTVSRDETVTATAQSSSSLHIAGTAVDGDRYAETGRYPMQGYRMYRLSAWLRIDRCEPERPGPSSILPLPFVGCEFLTDDPGGILGRENLRITMWRRSEWNRLEGEFRAPWGTTGCRIVFDDNLTHLKDRGKYTVDFHVDDIRLERIERFTVDDNFYSKKVPRSIGKTRGMHPRLYLTNARLAELRGAAGSTHARLLEELLDHAESLLKSGPPEWRPQQGEFDEQWWMANNGPSMINLALAYLMTGDERFRDGARLWALETCAYPGWGKGGADCMTGHNLFGLAVTYDWLYNDLDPDALSKIRETLIKWASHMYGRATSGTMVPTIELYTIRPWPEWEEAWLQNHLWVNSSGLLAAGLALYDEADEASAWAGFALDRFSTTMRYLGPDGASHEGINYWSYGIEHLLKSMHLIRDLLGVDLYDNEWFRNTARYRIAMSIPRNAWKRGSTTVNYGDSHARDSYGPDTILRALAAEYRDSHAQYLAAALDNADILNPGNRWLNLLWYDPSVPEEQPDTLPTFYHFTDQEIVSTRSDWFGDGSFLFYKCGPYIGNFALDTMNYCASSAHHTHPDQNEFMLFGAGEWLMSDDGNYGKYTGQHNTLIIDGGEQLGGGESIFDGSRLHALKRRPRIIIAENGPDLDHIAGDAAEAYAPETGLRKFTRHLLYLKNDNVLIVCDDIGLDAPRDLELRFHPGPQEASKEGAAFVTRTEASVMRFEPLTPNGLGITAEKHPLVDRRYNVSDMLAFRLTKHDRRWRNAVAISWAEAGNEPVKVSATETPGGLTFMVGGKQVPFRWER